MPTKDELFDRAVDLVADGDLDGAIAVYEQAIAVDPNFADAVQGIAMAASTRNAEQRVVNAQRSHHRSQ
jgi:hypothetical protein